MAKNWLSRLSLAAVIGAAVSTTSCSSDGDKDSGEWITPNNAEVAVLYYSNGGDLDASTEWDLVGAAYELCTETRNVRFFVQHKYSGQKAYDQYIAKERQNPPSTT